MVHARAGAMRFDPEFCPLLKGLSPEEKRARMESDPLIRACIQSVETGNPYPVECNPHRPAAAGLARPRKGSPRPRRAAIAQGV